MHIEQAQCDQAKMELSNKPWLDQKSNHYNTVTTMLIHTLNEQPNMRANKLKCKICPTLNQCTIHKVYASRNKILQGHKSEST